MAQTSEDPQQKEPLKKFVQVCCWKSEGFKGKKLCRVLYILKTCPAVIIGLVLSLTCTHCQYMLNYTKRMSKSKALFFMATVIPVFSVHTAWKKSIPTPKLSYVKKLSGSGATKIDRVRSINL